MDMAVEQAGPRMPKVAIYRVCITTPSRFMPSLHIENTCEEDVGCLAALAYPYGLVVSL